jgi:rRNA-processing protein FCF1
VEPAPISFSEPAHVPQASRNGTVVVVLDSSSLFLPFQFRIDPVAETKRLLHKPLEFVVPGPVAEEIRRVLTIGYGGSKRDAKAALQYAERFPQKPGRGQGDDAVLNMAIDERHAGKTAVIVTTDVGLRRRARAFHVPVLFMRNKGHLMLDGYIE